MLCYSRRVTRGVRPRRSPWASAFYAAAFLALALRALIPAGYMLGPGAGANALVVTLCGGGGLEARLDPKTGAVELGGHAPAHDSQSDHSHAPCAFAAVAPLAAPTDAEMRLAPRAAGMSFAVATASLIPGRGLAAPPPWSTGPPALA